MSLVCKTEEEQRWPPGETGFTLQHVPALIMQVSYVLILQPEYQDSLPFRVAHAL